MIARSRTIAVLALASAVVAATGCGTDRSSEPPLAQPSVRKIAKTTPEAARPLKPGAVVVHIKRSTPLRAKPNGKVIAQLVPKTSFNSPTVLAVVRKKGDWYGVITPEVPNGQIGWISTRAATGLYENDFRIDVSLTEREITVRRGRKVEARFPVAIGRASSPTPVGRYAITDKLITQGGASPYGCCILATSAHQKLTPQGWGGGDRIAIHATDHPDTIGSAVSLGCLRAPEDVMRRMVRLVPLGTLVTIRA